MIAIIICKCWLFMALASAPPPEVSFNTADGGWSTVLLAGAMR
ncbi:hypothetical protein PPN31119_01435 [Pandoraea pnomenusa]|jgi:hypothetical protein|uniref:Uncharacterized protein n=1 Tax=Pandoraea pnomenusa TaxID=93220 RepID=A0A378YX65_9BURK|nr:Uncharacterised protein [Pandoraea pnomenusa]VVE64027.1 hypothetical protein PPN31119_01435 [Pandoraea pnomenusa]